MTEREKGSLLREAELKKIKQFYEEQGCIIERILSQNSPSSLLLFTEDAEKNERYIEIKFIIKKPDYTPDEDIDAYQMEIERRANKQVRANLNKMTKKERLAAEPQAEKQIREIIESFK